MNKIECKKLGMSRIPDEKGVFHPVTLLDVRDGLKDVDISKLSELKISGVSKGKGFAGVIKKHGFRCAPRTHGHMRRRHGGSIGSQGMDRVWKGKKMPGRMGNSKVSIKGVKPVKLDGNILAVHGSVPGSRKSKVVLEYKLNEE